MQIITVILLLFFVPVSAKAMNSGAGNLDDAITTLATYDVDTHFEDCPSDADYNGYYDTADNYIVICHSRDADHKDLLCLNQKHSCNCVTTSICTSNGMQKQAILATSK
jgi:hypothetical protein